MKLTDFDDLTREQKENAADMLAVTWWIKRGLFIVLLLVVSIMAGCPMYNVWQQGLVGEAELAKAEQNKQIRIEEAAARRAAASDLAEAERIRAEGVKDANQIIAEGLGGPEGYLRYLYINGLNSEDSNCSVIYVPTEAGLPILEAGLRP